MVIGNTPQIAASFFKPGYTLASVIANEFTEATTDCICKLYSRLGWCCSASQFWSTFSRNCC